MTDDSLRLLPVDIERDIDRAHELITRCELEAMGWSDTTRDEVVSMLANPVALTAEHRFAVVGDDPVGLLVMEVDRPAREVFSDAYAVGADHGPVLARLVAHGLEVARGVVAAEPAPPAPDADPFVVSADVWQVLSGSHPEDVAYSAVLRDAGFRPVRRFWRMVLDLAGRSGVEPTGPAGVTVRAAADDADRRTIHALEQDSFSEHFGSGHAVPYEEWLSGLEARPGHDPARWWIASLDGTPVGFCILDHSQAEFGHDHVPLLGVVRQARGRGIGRWLLERAAAQAAARGQAGLALSVDGENTTGATALYESLGFATQHVIDVWCYPMTGG